MNSIFTITRYEIVERKYTELSWVQNLVCQWFKIMPKMTYFCEANLLLSIEVSTGDVLLINNGKWVVMKVNGFSVVVYSMGLINCHCSLDTGFILTNAYCGNTVAANKEPISEFQYRLKRKIQDCESKNTQ